MKAKVCLGIVTAVVLCTLAAGAQAPTGTVRVNVRLDGTEKPVSGVELLLNVILRSVHIENGSPVVLNSLSIRTDVMGNYSFPGTRPGDYAICVMANASNDATYYPGVSDLEEATLLPVESGKNIVGIEITMR